MANISAPGSCRLVLGLWLVLLLWLLPASVAAASLANSLEMIQENGESVNFRFQEQVYSYEIWLTAEQQLTLKLSAPGCLIIDHTDYRAEGAFSRTYRVRDGEILIFTISNAAETVSNTYSIYFHLREQEQPDPPPQPDGPAPEPEPGPEQPAPIIWPGPEPDPGPVLPEELQPLPGIPPFPAALQEALPQPIHLCLRIGVNSMQVNDMPLPLDTAPFMLFDQQGGGYTMVPLRFIAEAFGAQVSWDGEQRTVGIALHGSSFTLRIGQTIAGSPAAVMLRDDRTFVPLRYVMETLGAEVYWQREGQRIDIYYQPPAGSR